MTKAFVTLAVGPHEELLDIALPSFEEFCDRHGYDLLIADPVDCDRPPSWWKVPALKAALAEYNEAFFVGADVVIVDPTDDVPIASDAWQALVEHETGDGSVPNADIWYVRRPMLPILDEMWALTHHIRHGWWEQAALLELMGYNDLRPIQRVKETELYARTTFLDAGWNMHLWDRRDPERPRLRHATMWPDRAGIMREWAVEAENQAGVMVS